MHIHTGRLKDYLKTVPSLSTKAPTCSTSSEGCWAGPAPFVWGCCKRACKGVMIGSRRARVAAACVSPGRQDTTDATASITCRSQSHIIKHMYTYHSATQHDIVQHNTHTCRNRRNSLYAGPCHTEPCVILYKDIHSIAHTYTYRSAIANTYAYHSTIEHTHCTTIHTRYNVQYTLHAVMMYDFMSSYTLLWLKHPV